MLLPERAKNQFSLDIIMTGDDRITSVYTDDKEIIRDVNEDFQKSFEKSTQIKPESAKKHNIFFRFFAIIAFDHHIQYSKNQ